MINCKQKKQKRKKIIENILIPIAVIGSFIGYGCIVIFANKTVFIAFTITIIVIIMMILIIRESKK